jgi:hypothetical protein
MTSETNNRRSSKRDPYSDTDDIQSSEKSSFLLIDLLPVPLRNCLSGQEPHSKRSIFTEDAPSISIPMLRASVCSDESVVMNSKGGAGHNNNQKHRDVFSTTGECQSVSDDIHNVTMGSYTTVSSLTSENLESEYDFETSDKAYSFLSFRLSYLFVTLVVMLADGLQGESRHFLSLRWRKHLLTNPHLFCFWVLCFMIRHPSLCFV